MVESDKNFSSKSKITRTPAETVDINSVVHRSLSDLSVPSYRRRRKVSLFSRLSTLVRFYWSQKRSNEGV